MRIAIVNDVLLAVEALRRVVTSVPDYTIAWVARHGAEAVEQCAADTPDLILMDLIMPVLGSDGQVEGGAALLDKIAMLAKLLTPTPRQEPQRSIRSAARASTRHL